MLDRKRGLAAIVLAVLSTAVAAPANATGVRGCSNQGTATFIPALTSMSVTNGKVTLDYDRFCVGADHTGASGTQTDHYSVTYRYDGSCLTASLGGANVTGAVVGGVTGVTVALFNDWQTVGVRDFVLVPHSLNPCNMSTATFVGAGSDISA